MIKSFFGREKISAFLLKILQEEREKILEGTLLRPLSDEMIGEKLEENYGIKIARRTINKYRRKIGKLSSFKRRPKGETS